MIGSLIVMNVEPIEETSQLGWWHFKDLTKVSFCNTSFIPCLSPFSKITCSLCSNPPLSSSNNGKVFALNQKTLNLARSTTRKMWWQEQNSKTRSLSFLPPRLPFCFHLKSTCSLPPSLLRGSFFCLPVREPVGARRGGNAGAGDSAGVEEGVRGSSDAAQEQPPGLQR